VSELMKDKGKQTLAPKLRFPEFRDGLGWETAPLDDLADFVSDRIDTSLLSLSNYVSTENILPDFGGITKAAKLPATNVATKFTVDDILVSNIRPYLRKVWQSDREGGASNDVIVIRPKDAQFKTYLPFVLKSDSFISYVTKGAKGVKMPRGDVALMAKYPVSYANAREQQKIADCLTSLDELIAARGRKLEVLRVYKKGLMQQLFPRQSRTIPRLRFPEFREASAWRERKISDLVEKAAIPIDVEPTGTYREIGVRSHVKVIFHKEPVSGSTSGEKRVYRVVENAFVVNIVFAWEQAVATTSKEEVGMIASHRFPMYVPKSGDCDVRFIKLVFLTPAGKHLLGVASPGGAGRNRTLGQAEFEKLEIVAPDKEEQTKIADAIDAVDHLIRSQTEMYTVLQAHKQGLMQQLFPSEEVDS
jgi:type I restriction enzyme S subunit